MFNSCGFYRRNSLIDSRCTVEWLWKIIYQSKYCSQMFYHHLTYKESSSKVFANKVSSLKPLINDKNLRADSSYSLGSQIIQLRLVGLVDHSCTLSLVCQFDSLKGLLSNYKILSLMNIPTFTLPFTQAHWTRQSV